MRCCMSGSRTLHACRHLQAEMLCKNYAPAGCGQGHGPEFFQAVIEQAAYFGMTPEQLIKKL